MPVPITADTDHFITLDEVKRAANIPVEDVSNDDELAIIQGAAEDAVEGLIGPVRWRTVMQGGQAAAGVVVLNTLPALSLTSVTSGGVTLTGDLDARTGIVSGLSYSSGAVTSTYIAGRDSCPDAVRQAALIIAAHLWETQRGNSPSALPDDDVNAGDGTGIGYAIPRRAEDLLAPYLSLPGWV